jgi:hypothetical protein
VSRVAVWVGLGLCSGTYDDARCSRDVRRVRMGKHVRLNWDRIAEVHYVGFT